MTIYRATCGRCGRLRGIESALAETVARELADAIAASRAGVLGSSSEPGDPANVVTRDGAHGRGDAGPEDGSAAPGHGGGEAPLLGRRVRPTPVDPRRDGRPLFEAGGGKMLGVLVADAPDGRRVRRLAFSGMYGGVWELPGWAPPLFDAAAWYALEATYDPEINALGADPGARARRAALSAALMRRYHDLYRLPNAAGVERGLGDFFGASIPSGAGDCCGPKLLAWAHRQGLRPRSLCELFVGEPRRPGTREHGACYSPCDHKCGPIMGFLLCDCAGDG